MKRQTWQRTAFAIIIAIGTGVMLRQVVDLTPVWWLAWLAQIPILLIAFSTGRGQARALVLLAALIGMSANLGYMRLVMPLPQAIAALFGLALLWMAVVTATRAVVRRYDGWWVVFAYPVLWIAVDTLMAAWLPDGNWGSLGYSQSGVLPLLQAASLFGVAGVLLPLCLLPSTVAVLLWRGRGLRHRWLAAGVTAVVLVAAFGFGWWRLQAPATGDTTRVGLASIDDAIGLEASPKYAEGIRSQYDAHVASLADAGAGIIVLPEKIAVLAPDAAARWKSHFATLARRNAVWLDVGITVDDGRQASNQSWLFDPQGLPVATYEKQKLAPPERREHYASGHGFALHDIGRHKVGLAICKDMHFASFGRQYAQRGAAVMLVPAWDFGYLDAWLETRTTMTRGVEGGYAVIRASREGLLSVSDAHGRVIAEAPSAAMPGATLLADVRIGDRVDTLYARIGNLLGWLCVAMAAFFVVVARRR